MAERYATVVVDPPWYYEPFGISRVPAGEVHDGRKNPLPYPTMTVEEIAALPVSALAAEDAHLYLWTTNRYLPQAFGVVEAWGFNYSTTLIWCKAPIGGFLGGAFSPSAEFVLFARRGNIKAKRVERQWWEWPRAMQHSKKPEAFLDIVEQVSPGPYLELFARRNRLGWSTWGDQALNHIELPDQGENDALSTDSYPLVDTSV